MAETSLVPYDPKSLSKTQARDRLDQNGYINWLIQSDMSDARRYLELARYSTRKHEKAEMIAGFVLGLLSGVFSNVLGGVVWPVALIVGLLAFLLTVLVVFAINWIRAPSAFYKHALVEAESAKRLLEEEKKKNTRPAFVARVLEIITESYLNTWQDRWFFKGSIRDHAYDCFVAIHLSITNNSIKAAPISGFELEATWEGALCASTEALVEGYFVKRRVVRPALGGDPINKYKDNWESLEPFPLNMKITDTNYLTGWTRFYLGTFPPDAVTGDAPDSVQLRLKALDHRNESHTVYEGTIILHGGYGTIADWATVERELERNKPL
jgi:hypothetical protein